MKKKITMVVSLLLVMALSIGGTIAFLTDTATVTNTFTIGNIDITLEESEDLDLKMIPGETIDKDPVVTVVGGSEACWLFIEITESDNLDDFIAYSVITPDWTELEEGIYYMAVDASEDDQLFAILTDNEVTVKEDVEKEHMDALTEDTLPKLTFTAYAIQQAGFDAVADAWDEVSK